MNTPHKATIDPADDAVEQIVEELQLHPEFALSRREIAKYIVTPPGQRSMDVQSLLRLDHIERLRKALNSYNNKCNSEYKEAERARLSAKGDLKTALGVSIFDCEEVLEKANAQRTILGLAALTQLTPQTSFNEGVPEEGKDEKRVKIAKNVALSDLKVLFTAIETGESNDLKQHRENALASLNKLRADGTALSLARAHGFVTTGLDFVIEDACPLCDEPWDADKLRAHLKAKLLSGEKIKKLLADLGTANDAVIGAIECRAAEICKAAGYAAKLDPAVSHAELDKYVKTLNTAKDALKAFESDHSQIDEAIAALEWAWWVVPDDAMTRLDETERA